MQRSLDLEVWHDSSGLSSGVGKVGGAPGAGAPRVTMTIYMYNLSMGEESIYPVSVLS